MSSIPIDPALLTEDELRAGMAGLEAFPPSDDEADLEVDDDEAVDGPGVNDESSGIESDSEDAYVDSEEEGIRASGSSRPASAPQNDAVFKRLAGVVGQSNDLDAAAMDLNAEIDTAELDTSESMLDKPLTRRQTRALPKIRNVHRPSYEVQRLVGRANVAYAQGELDQTVKLFLEVIRHDPYVIGAWNTLASVYEEQGNEEGARQMRFCAAHVEDEADTWRDLARQFRQRGQIQQCIYCLQKALRRDGGNDLGVLMELASIYRLKQMNAKGIDAFRRILKLHVPSTHDFAFLASFHGMLVAANQRKLASSTYRTAFDWHIIKSRLDDPMASMKSEHILQLVDDLEIVGQLEEAVVVIRRGQRWLQDRQADRKWDSFDDDREYDPLGVGRDEEGNAVEMGLDGEEVESNPMDTPFRHRLALLRLKLGDDEQAMVHVGEMLTLDVVDNHALIMELGEQLLRREMWDRALICFGVIQECKEIDDTPELLYNIGVCHHERGETKEAIEALEFAIEQFDSNPMAKYRLAKVYEDTGRKDEALELINEFIRDKASREGFDTTTTRAPRAKMTKVEKAGERTLTKRVLEDQMRTRMQVLWEQVQTAEAEIQEGHPTALDRFIEAAGTMVENFRLAKSNFGKNRGVTRAPFERKAKRNDLESQALALQDRLERGLGFEDDVQPDGPVTYIVKRQTEFFGLNCEDWLNLIIKYCAVLMVKNEQDLAMDILEHVLFAGLFNNRRAELALRLTVVSCAMRMKAYDKIVDNCKRLSQLFQFRMEPLLLLLACLSGGGEKADIAWKVLQLQKFIHRDLTIHDGLVRGHRSTYSKRFARWHPIVKIGVSRRLGDEEHYDEGAGNEVVIANGRGGSKKGGSSNTGGQRGRGRGKSTATRGRQTGRSESRDRDEEDDDEDEFQPEEDDLMEDGEDDEEDGYEEGEDGEGGEEEYETPRPTISSATLNVIYGQYMLSTKANQSALFYLFRAYELTPNEPLISLCIAQAYFGRSTNRQSDNRNHQIATGMMFLSKYRDLSPKDKKSVEEVEYNFGRSFDHFGVTHLAVDHYERVLTSVGERMEEAGPEYAEEVKMTSLAMKAAHCLMLIYGAVGNIELVKIKSAWLAI